MSSYKSQNHRKIAGLIVQFLGNDQGWRSYEAGLKKACSTQDVKNVSSKAQYHKVHSMTHLWADWELGDSWGKEINKLKCLKRKFHQIYQGWNLLHHNSCKRMLTANTNMCIQRKYSLKPENLIIIGNRVVKKCQVKSTTSKGKHFQSLVNFLNKEKKNCNP